MDGLQSFAANSFEAIKPDQDCSKSPDQIKQLKNFAINACETLSGHDMAFHFLHFLRLNKDFTVNHVEQIVKKNKAKHIVENEGSQYGITLDSSAFSFKDLDFQTLVCGALEQTKKLHNLLIIAHGSDKDLFTKNDFCYLDTAIDLIDESYDKGDADYLKLIEYQAAYNVAYSAMKMTKVERNIHNSPAIQYHYLKPALGFFKKENLGEMIADMGLRASDDPDFDKHVVDTLCNQYRKPNQRSNFQYIIR